MASTFTEADHRHVEQQLRGSKARRLALDFMPQSRFLHYWARAVNGMGGDSTAERSRVVRAAAAEAAVGAGTKEDSVTTTVRGGGRAQGGDGDRTGSGDDASAGAQLQGLGEPDGVHLNAPVSVSGSNFTITPRYAALHWRRGDKCGFTTTNQRGRREGPGAVTFNASQSGSAAVLMCSPREYLYAKVTLHPLSVTNPDSNHYCYSQTRCCEAHQTICP